MARTESVADRTGVVISAIIGELAKLGHTAMRANYRRGDAPCIEFDDGIQVEVAVQQRGEKRRLIVGSYVDDPGRKNFPEPKGGFRLGEVAALILRLAEARRAKKAAEARARTVSEIAAGINEALGINSRSVRASSDGNGHLVLSANAPGTAEQITAMLRLAIELGLVESTLNATSKGAA